MVITVDSWGGSPDSCRGGWTVMVVSTVGEHTGSTSGSLFGWDGLCQSWFVVVVLSVYNRTVTMTVVGPV